MKSGMVKNADYISEKTGYSELQILSSAAGFYIGTTYTDPENGFCEPGSRDSDYYATYKEAERALTLLGKLGEETAHAVLRQSP